MGYIKGVLIIIFKYLEKQAIDWRSDYKFIVLVKRTPLPKLKKYKFKQFTKDKPKIYLKHLVYYTTIINSICK